MKFLEDKRIARELEKSLKEKTLSHAYLFYGPRGIGKCQMAKSFAKTMICGEDPRDKSFCQLAHDFDHPDLIFIKSQGSIKKAQVEELIDRVGQKPFESQYKVVIIDNFHNMTTEGQNALLKTLEEPPSYLNLFLISHNLKGILPTIKSRCRLMKFKTVSTNRLESFLQDYGISEKNARLFARLSKGSVAQSLRYYEDSTLLQKREELIDQVDRLLREGRYTVFSSLDYFKDHREQIDEILGFLLTWFRDLSFMALGQEENIINIDKLELLQLENVSLTHSLHCYDSVLQTVEELKMNINFDLAIQMLLMNIGGI
ncbi:MAG: DNA polymerase III subunit [Tissierellia bacterium]|nr:DNA polymerase III subunit [Tissierellia bacterium]